MQFRLRNGLAATAVATVIAASAIGVAGAASPAPVPGGPAGIGPCATQSAAARSIGTVAAIRAFGDCEIDRRLATLGQLSAAVDASKGLTSADAAALTGKIETARSGLAGLRATIDGQASLAALKLDIIEIATRYRVYVLLGPQVRLANAADDVMALKPHLDEMSTALAGRIGNAQAAGKSVTAAQTALDDMNSQISKAQSLASPLPAQLLALTPAQFNAGTAGPVVQSARSAAVQARDALKVAVQDARTVIADLK